MLTFFETLAARLRRPKLSRSLAAVLAPPPKPRTATDVWCEGFDDAKARRCPVNSWPSGSELGAAYEQGFIAGVAARGFVASG